LAVASPRAGSSVDGREWLAELIEGVRLTPKGRAVALALSRSPQDAAFMSASQLAREVGVNAATVVRFAQSLGFSGWKEFQLHFRQRFLTSILPAEMGGERAAEPSDSPFEAVVHHDIENLRDALSSIDRRALANVVRTLDGARKTLVVSSGSDSAVGHILVHKMTVMGYDARLETRGGIHAITALSNIGSEDCLVAISFLRMIRHVVVGIQEAERRGIPSIAFTDSIVSPLARAATYTLTAPTEGVSWFQSLTAAVSVVNGVTSELQAVRRERVDEAIGAVEGLYDDFDVLYRWD
jgi:DNA-binding MurR/RpiR family transcriptional regulator